MARKPVLNPREERRYRTLNTVMRLHTKPSTTRPNFFSQLKRSLDGTHHHVSQVHLPRYLAEFDFRHSTRKTSDTARMQKLMGQVAGRRLTYKHITSA